MISEKRPKRDRSGGLRVLVVDDNWDIAESLAMLLELRRHRVRIAHNGPEALAAAAEFAPEVVLIDIGLPGMDGYELARRLRTQREHDHSHLIALSGRVEDERRSREVRFDHHIVKPAEPQLIIDLLETYQRGD